MPKVTLTDVVVDRVLSQAGLPNHWMPPSFAAGQSGVFPNAPVSVDFTGIQLSYQTEVNVDGMAETVVPHPEIFDQKTQHLVIIATPFGVGFKGF